MLRHNYCSFNVLYCASAYKAFDKVWHAGLLRTLEALGVQSPLFQWFENYLRNRKQRVVIEGQCSDWRTVNFGVPQGSVLGPLLFLIYINDITDDLASLPLIYADDTTLLEIVDDPAVYARRRHGGHWEFWLSSSY